ncbi:MAG: UDP-3-O-(3-hydroxymyristoyl)glucosamine N-acyltransferase [Gammaproteobacteria bacterium]|nr:UDP-3-O-(3-hydroxymyristoyl)glucosamine N-acyltransferase [Gammaproteobacteria bacterium]
MAIKLSQLAERTGCRMNGSDCLIENVADIHHAEQGQLAFVYNPKYLDAINLSKASAIIIKEEWLSKCNKPALISDNPRLAFAKVASMLNPTVNPHSGVLKTACIADDVTIPDSVSIAENVVICTGVKLGKNVVISAGVVISENVAIENNVYIHPNVSVGKGSKIGHNCNIYSGVVIGADGFGYVRDGDSYLKVPQLGNVTIGSNVDIGANTTIDRGALLDTIIHDGVKLDNQIQVAHNVEIGENTVISACAAIGGSAKIGKNCLIGGAVGIRDNVEITDNVVITGRTFVTSSIKESGSYSSSMLLDRTKNWKKNVIRLKHLDDMAKRLKVLENKVCKSNPGSD